MGEQESGGEGASSYTAAVGERLRRVRAERGMSLQDVERSSNGYWKAAVIGSYERGDRNISATRLLELAEFYGVRPADVLPGEPPARTSSSNALVLDLERLALAGERYDAIRRYLDSIQIQRGDYNRQVLSVRGEDLRALAVLHDSSPEQLVAELSEIGAVREPGAEEDVVRW